MQIYEEYALFLCQRGARKRNHVFHCWRKQEYLHKWAGNHFPFVVELKSDRHIKRIVSGSFSEREKFTVQCFQLVHLIIIRSLEIGGTDGAEIRVILFRHFGTEEKTTVLRHAYQRLSDCHIVTFFHENTFHISGNRSRNALADSRMILRKSFVTKTGVFVTLLRLCKILVGYNLVFNKLLHTFVFLLGYLVGNAGTLHRITIGDILWRNSD